MQTTVIHDSATTRLAPADDLLALLATSPAARRAAVRLVAQHLARWRIGIYTAAMALGVILAVLGYASAHEALYWLSAAAMGVALVVWVVWFQEWR